MKIYVLCLEFLPHVAGTSSIEVKPINSNNVKRKPKKTVKSIKKSSNDDCMEQQSESDNEFEDLNNQFAQLLKM